MSKPSSLDVIVPLDWAWKKGYVAGFVQVIVSTPRAAVEKGLLVTSTDGSFATLRLPVAKLYDTLGSGTGDLAAVHVNLYLYDREGRLCVSAATLDTLGFVLLRGGGADAWKRAIKEPDILLKAGTIRIDRAMFTPCIRIDQVLAKTLRSEVREALGSNTRREIGLNMFLPLGSQTIIVNEELYNARDTPPNIWLQRLRPESTARQAWRLFATKFSQALLIPRNRVSFEEALVYAARWYGLAHWKSRGDGSAVYGVVPVDDLIASLLGRVTPVAWRHTYPAGTVVKHFERAPLVRIKACCPTCSGTQYPIVSGFLAASSYISVNAGLSIMGVIVWPVSRSVLSIEGASVSLRLTKGLDDWAIYAPMDDVYLYDGMLVLLLSGTTSVNSRQYWIFTPVVNTAPIHYYRFDLNRIDANAVSQVRGIHEALSYMTMQAKPTGGYITPESVTLRHMYLRDSGPGYIATLDSFKSTAEYGNNLAAFIAYTANVALWSAISAIVPPAYVLIPEAASTLVSVAYMDARAAASLFELKLRGGGTGHTLEITVEKYTQRHLDTKSLPQGSYPTLVEYTVWGVDHG